MEMYTNDDASSFIIRRMIKISSGGNFLKWEITVKSPEGQVYIWDDLGLAENASKTAVKARIKEYLTGQNGYKGIPKPAPKVVEEEVTNKGVGETL